MEQTDPSGLQAGSKRVVWTRSRRSALEGYTLLLPSFLFMGLIIFYPLFRSLQLSLNRFKITEGIDSERFCGLCNFVSLFHDPFLSTYLRNQVTWVIGATVLPILLGLLLALILNQEIKFRWFWRAIILVPWMMPVATSALTWRWIGFLTDRAWLWPSIFLVAMWVWFPYNYVALLAALSSIPTELYEAGKVDGTNAWTAFWQITLPSIAPVLTLLVVLGVVWTMNDFTTIFLLTEGGPGIDSTTLAPLVYKTSFRYFDLGKGAATGVTLMVISLIFGLLYIRQTRNEP
jgi:multiple sugar transport system permease protein